MIFLLFPLNYNDSNNNNFIIENEHTYFVRLKTVEGSLNLGKQYIYEHTYFVRLKTVEGSLNLEKECVCVYIYYSKRLLVVISVVVASISL